MTTFVLTAGHSDTDPGAASDGYTEAKLMTTLRDRTAAVLRGWGHTVIEDGADGQNLPLQHAIGLIPRGVLAVELHTNAAESRRATGVETIALPKLKTFAQVLSQQVANQIGTRVRGDRGWIDQSQSARGRLGYVNAGGVILETFFINNPDERQAYFDALDRVAAAIAGTMHGWVGGKT